MKHIIDLRDPPKDLPPLDFQLTDADRIKVEQANVAIDLHVMDLNERAKRQG